MHAWISVAIGAFGILINLVIGVLQGTQESERATASESQSRCLVSQVGIAHKFSDLDSV
jgi:hypothetical protein